MSSAFRGRDRDVMTFAAESSSPMVAVASGVVTIVALTTAPGGDDGDGDRRGGLERIADADAHGRLTTPTGTGRSASMRCRGSTRCACDLDGTGCRRLPRRIVCGGVRRDGVERVQCGDSGCSGYEIGGDLSLGTNTSGGPDAGDAWRQGGDGWLPVGTTATPFTARFEGDGKLLRHLYIARGDAAGLCGATGAWDVVHRVGLTSVRGPRRSPEVGEQEMPLEIGKDAVMGHKPPEDLGWGLGFGQELASTDRAGLLQISGRATGGHTPEHQGRSTAAGPPGRRRPPGWQSPRRAERECAPPETPGAAAAATATTPRPPPPKRPPCRAATAARTDTAGIRGRRSGSQAAAGSTNCGTKRGTVPGGDQ